MIQNQDHNGISMGTVQRMSERRFGILKQQRIRRAADFSRVYEARVRASNLHLLIYAAPNKLGLTRFGLSVSRKHGNAVKRNRMKRLLREAFRLSQNKLPRGFDLILIPQRNSEASLQEYQSALKTLTQKLQQRWFKTIQNDGRIHGPG